MANRKLINFMISIKIGFQEFFGITNSPSDIQNSRWWKKFFLISNFDQIWYMGIFDVDYYEFNEFSKLIISDRERLTKGDTLLNFNANWYLRFFKVASSESTFIFSKFKMAYSI